MRTEINERVRPQINEQRSNSVAETGPPFSRRIAARRSDHTDHGSRGSHRRRGGRDHRHAGGDQDRARVAAQRPRGEGDRTGRLRRRRRRRLQRHQRHAALRDGRAGPAAPDRDLPQPDLLDDPVLHRAAGGGQLARVRLSARRGRRDGHRTVGRHPPRARLRRRHRLRAVDGLALPRVAAAREQARRDPRHAPTHEPGDPRLGRDRDGRPAHADDRGTGTSGLGPIGAMGIASRYLHADAPARAADGVRTARVLAVHPALRHRGARRHPRRVATDRRVGRTRPAPGVDRHHGAARRPRARVGAAQQRPDERKHVPQRRRLRPGPGSPGGGLPAGANAPTNVLVLDNTKVDGVSNAVAQAPGVAEVSPRREEGPAGTKLGHPRGGSLQHRRVRLDPRNPRRCSRGRRRRRPGRGPDGRGTTCATRRPATTS